MATKEIPEFDKIPKYLSGINDPHYLAPIYEIGENPIKPISLPQPEPDYIIGESFLFDAAVIVHTARQSSVSDDATLAVLRRIRHLHEAQRGVVPEDEWKTVMEYYHLNPSAEPNPADSQTPPPSADTV